MDSSTEAFNKDVDMLLNNHDLAEEQKKLEQKNSGGDEEQKNLGSTSRGRGGSNRGRGKRGGVKRDRKSVV